MRKNLFKSGVSIVIAAAMFVGGFPGAPFTAKAASEDVPFAQSIWPNFQNPPPESKSAPLWFWNEEIEDMDDDALREMVRQSYHDSGYRGFGILPNWIGDYMNEAYFHKYEVVLEECAKLGMKLSLYDENGYPSYAAGGLLEEKYPDLTAKRLDKVERDVSGPASVTLDLPEGKLMSAVAMNTSTLELIDISDLAEIVMIDPGDIDAGTGAYSSSNYSAAYDAHKAFDGNFNTDGNGGTRWNSQSGLGGANQWIELRYAAPVKVDQVNITEAAFNRIKSCAIQVWDGSKYVTVATGTTIGAEITKIFAFDEVETTRVRFFAYDCGGNDATIRQMEVYSDGVKLAVPDQKAPAGPQGDTLTWNLTASGIWKVMAFMCVKDGAWGMDYLDRNSVAKFIELTHQAYYERFPEYFPKGDSTAPDAHTKPVFDASFYDEPSWHYIAQGASKSSYGVKGSRAWTPGYNEEFIDQKGYDPAKFYPALWYDIGAETAGIRKDFHDVRAELFSRDYIGQVNEWCENHGLELTGHMLVEELQNPVSNCGDLMKAFKRQAIPGVDVVGSYRSSQEAYKVISSSAYNWDKGRVMVECYGAMGEGMGEDMLYRQAMDLYAKGINYMIPHAIWSDQKNVIHPPELSYRNPNYNKALWTYNEYIGRLQQMLWDGRHVADIAMLYPIDYLESVFKFTSTDSTDTCVPSDNNYMTVGEELSLRQRRDFTYLHPEILDEKCEVMPDGTLHLENDINFEDYKVFIIPSTQLISLSNAQKIKAFYDAGGKVISVGTSLPSKASEGSAHDQDIKDIMAEIFGATPSNTGKSNAAGGLAIRITSHNGSGSNNLKTALDLSLSVYDVEFTGVGDISGSNFTYIHKIKEGTNIYFLANSSLTAQSGTADLRGELEPYAWDPHTGVRTALPYTHEVIDGVAVTRINFTIPAIYSMFVVDDDITSRGLKGLSISADTDQIGAGEFVNISGYKKTATLSVNGITENDESVPLPGSQLSFESLNPDVAQVDSFGVVTAVASGTAKIKVSFGAYEDTISISVENITLDAIELESDTALLRTGSAGSAAYLTVTGVLSDGTTTDISGIPGLDYVQSTPGLLTVSGIKAQKATEAPDTFSVLLRAALTLDGKTANSNDVLIKALPLKNIALPVNGGTASASSQVSNNHAASAAITGNRTGRAWGSGGGWNSGTMNAFPQWLQVAFSGGKKLIDEIDVYNLQDDYQNGVDPDPWMTFKSYGLTDFEVQYHDGTDFVAVPDASFKDNNIVWNRIRFDPIETDRIRIFVNFALAGYARVIEFEAWEADLTAVVDKSALLEVYNKYKGLDEAAYPSGIWEPFSAALNKAKNALTSDAASQTEIDRALSGLLEAGDILMKHLLNLTIQSVENLIEEDYMPDSWAALQTALSAAQETADNPNASQEEIEAATAALQSAIDTLERRIALQSIKINSAATTTVRKSKTLQLGVILTPSNANFGTGITWSSSNEASVKIDPETGLITGVKAGGSARITATSLNGKTYTITVTVDS